MDSLITGPPGMFLSSALNNIPSPSSLCSLWSWLPWVIPDSLCYCFYLPLFIFSCYPPCLTSIIWKPELIRELPIQPWSFLLMSIMPTCISFWIIWLYSQNFTAQDLWSLWVIFPFVSLAVAMYLFFLELFEVSCSVNLECMSRNVQHFTPFFCEFQDDMVSFPCFCHSHIATKFSFVGQS